MDRFLRDITGNHDLSFGGKVVVLGGDFRQCLPVIPQASTAQVLQSTVKGSDLWDTFSQNTFCLTHNQRSNNQAFSDWLLHIGNGTDHRNRNTDHVDFAQTPIQIVHSLDDLISTVYGNSINIGNLSTFNSTIILAPKNKQINLINEKVLDLIDTPSIQCLSVNHPILDGNHPVIPEEILETLQPSGFPPHIMNLKLGAVYMMLRNLNVKKGLCNGSRIAIRSIGTRLVFYDLLYSDGTVREENLLLPRITLTPTEGYPFMFQRTQYPIIPAYSGTFNKCQGCTFERIGIDLTEPCFSHGQLYVALSRARNFDKITLLLPEGETLVRNVVWRSILQADRIEQDSSIPPIEGAILQSEDNPSLDPAADFLNNDYLQFYANNDQDALSYSPVSASDSGDDHQSNPE